MHKERVKQSTLNLIWTTYIMAVTSVMPFVIRTLIVRMIGLEYSGVSNLFTAILSVMNLTELGVESAVSFYLYKSMAEEDYELTGAILKLFRKVYRMVGAVMLIAGIILLPFLPVLVRGKEYPEGLNIYFVFVIYMVYTALPYLTVGYRFVLFKGNQRGHISNIYNGTTCLIMYSLQVLAICLTRNYYLYVIIMLVNPVLQCVFLGNRAKKDYAEIQCEGQLSADFMKGFKKRIAAIILSKIRNISRNAFDSIIISSFLGLTILAKYQNYYQVMYLPFYATTLLHAAVMPSFGNSVALETKESNYGVLELYSFLQCGMNAVCCSCLINLFQPFMKLWMGEKYLLPFYMVILFCIYFYLLAVSDIAVLLREVTGIWWEGRYVAVAEAAVNLLLNIVLVRFFGVAGVILATIMVLLLINLPFEFYYVFRNYYQGGGKGYFLSQVRYALCTGLITVISYFVGRFIIVTGIPTMILKIIASVLVPVVCFTLLFIRSPYLKDMIRIIQGLISSVQKRSRKRF